MLLVADGLANMRIADEVCATTVTVRAGGIGSPRKVWPSSAGP